MRSGAAAVGAAALLASAAPTAEACDLALVLAHDVSQSVSRLEYALQTLGHADAFRDAEVQERILEIGGVSVMLAHWSGSPHQELVIPWRRLETRAEIESFADALAEAPRIYEGYATAIGDMLLAMETVWSAEIEDCQRRVIDVSGDGASNDGAAVAPARERLIRAGITINGLVTVTEDPVVDDPYLYYLENVIGGFGAFAMTAEGFEDYARAFKQKLLKELERPAVSMNAAPAERR